MRLMGFAELYGRLRRVVTTHGRDTVTAPSNTPLIDLCNDEQDAATYVSGVVLDSFGESDTQDVGPLHSGAAQEGRTAVGIALTAKAHTLADWACAFQEWQPWGSTVDLAAAMAHREPDHPADRRLSDAALLGVLWHVVAIHPKDMTTLPGLPPELTPLFIDGYPTTLFGHVAADLHANAVRASRLGCPSATDLFTALGWELTPRARHIIHSAQSLEGSGASWRDIATQINREAVWLFTRQEWDR